MKSEEIARQVSEINRLLGLLHLDLLDLQNICPHGNVKKEYGSNTGNWDASADKYWIKYHCRDCDKVWTENQ